MVKPKTTKEKIASIMGHDDYNSANYCVYIHNLLMRVLDDEASSRIMLASDGQNIIFLEDNNSYKLYDDISPIHQLFDSLDNPLVLKPKHCHDNGHYVIKEFYGTAKIISKHQACYDNDGDHMVVRLIDLADDLYNTKLHNICVYSNEYAMINCNSFEFYSVILIHDNHPKMFISTPKFSINKKLLHNFLSSSL